MWGGVPVWVGLPRAKLSAKKPHRDEDLMFEISSLRRRVENALDGSNVAIQHEINGEGLELNDRYSMQQLEDARKALESRMGQESGNQNEHLVASLPPQQEEPLSPTPRPATMREPTEMGDSSCQGLSHRTTPTITQANALLHQKNRSLEAKVLFLEEQLQQERDQTYVLALEHTRLLDAQADAAS